MERDVKQYLKWLGIVALAIIAANLLAGCSRPSQSAQTAPTPKEIIFVPSPTYVPVLPLLDTSNAAAMTSCDYQGNPVVYVRPPVLMDTFARRYILAHEAMHILDAWRYGCKAFVSRYVNDGDFKWDVEARAYCAAFDLMVKDGVARPEHWNSVIVSMRQYDTSLTDSEIPKFLPCRPP